MGTARLFRATGGQVQRRCLDHAARRSPVPESPPRRSLPAIMHNPAQPASARRVCTRNRRTWGTPSVRGSRVPSAFRQTTEHPSQGRSMTVRRLPWSVACSLVRRGQRSAARRTTTSRRKGHLTCPLRPDAAPQPADTPTGWPAVRWDGSARSCSRGRSRWRCPSSSSSWSPRSGSPVVVWGPVSASSEIDEVR